MSRGISLRALLVAPGVRWTVAKTVERTKSQTSLALHECGKYGRTSALWYQEQDQDISVERKQDAGRRTKPGWRGVKAKRDRHRFVTTPIHSPHAEPSTGPARRAQNCSTASHCLKMACDVSRKHSI